MAVARCCVLLVLLVLLRASGQPYGEAQDAAPEQHKREHVDRLAAGCQLAGVARWQRQPEQPGDQQRGAGDSGSLRGVAPALERDEYPGADSGQHEQVREYAEGAASRFSTGAGTMPRRPFRILLHDPPDDPRAVYLRELWG